MRNVFGRRDEDRDADDPMSRRLTADLRDMVADGEVSVDIDSVVRLGSRTLRRRRNITASGVAAGVVALVIGGTIVGRPAPTGVQTGASRVVPVCASSAVSSSEHWIASWSPASSADEGSSAPVTPTPTNMASRERAAQSSAASEASSAASAAERARAAAESSEQASTAATALSAGQTYRWEISPQAVPWFTSAKGVQLTDALRSAMPAEVTVLKGDDSWLRFEGGTRGVTTVAIGSGGPQVSPSFVLLTPEQDVPVQIPMVTAQAAVFKTDTGWGSLEVGIGSGTGIPPCSSGSIERRMVEKDGSAVDIGLLSSTAPGSTSDSPQHSLSVTAYRPDGTVVTAAVSTSGTVDQLPMTEDELVAVAVAPGLEVSASAAPIASAAPSATR